MTILSNLRVPEKLLLGFLIYLTLAAFLFPLDLRQRLAVLALNALVGSVIVTLSPPLAGDRARSRFLSVVRDWIPSILILVAYRESGLFFTPDPAHRLDYFFIRFDDALLKNAWAVRTLEWSAPWLQHYLEFSYFLCYPIVPLGLASLYLVRREVAAGGTCPDVVGSPPPDRPAALKGGATDRPYGPAIEHFWTAVLLASFTCYLLFPLFPLAPPRELFNDVPGPRVAPLLRGMNHWLLGKYAVGASLFPSAHVAATTAMALVIHRYLPRFGWLFVIVAVSIALATVYGRYHYAADALAGALVGVSAYLLSKRIFRIESHRIERGDP
jgi:membrane-associated phospholipid phosphatase